MIPYLINLVPLGQVVDHIVKNKINIRGREKYIEISRMFADDMQKVDGCVEARVLIPLYDYETVVNYEVWESKSHYENYDNAMFLKYKKRLKEYFISNVSEMYYI